MPSNHISNADYHDWIKIKEERERRKPYQIVVVPSDSGGWSFRVTKWSSCLPSDLDVAPSLEVERDEDLPAALHELQDFLDVRTDPPLAD